MRAKSFLLLALAAFLCSTTFSTIGFASSINTKSAHRRPGVSYLAYKAQAHLMSQGQHPPSRSTPVEEAKPYGQSKANLPSATAWSTQTEMKNNFEKFRDLRFLESYSRSGFARRSSWLYPDDGCFARAALAILNLSKWQITVPNKVYVFGDLAVKTKNSPEGEVTWWYHVAPLVEVSGVKYVLDPSIDPKNPLLLEDWLARMSKNPDALEVAVCGSGSYTPDDLCDKDTDGVERTALSEQEMFLDYEWARLQDLGRNPVNELGDLPPWL